MAEVCGCRLQDVSALPVLSGTLPRLVINTYYDTFLNTAEAVKPDKSSKNSSMLKWSAIIRLAWGYFATA
jgi:hypothetical protein